MPLTTGQLLNNRYRIVALLGQGGFGAVYRAWDANLKVPCAVKENFDTSSSAVRQFEREASILATLRHANLPRVTDHFIVEGQGQYLVMDFIEGQDLEVMLERSSGRLPEAQVVQWLAEICDALDYLHNQEIPVIHRDIKPANIKLTPSGRAMLVDFGIAKVYNPEIRTTLGARALTPGYSPFEQYGQAPTDARSDVYALGATAYTLLTGKVPAESIARMAGAPLEPVRTLTPEVSPVVEHAVLHALQLMPDQRFQSAREFKLALTAGSAPEPVHLAGRPAQLAPAGPPAAQITSKATGPSSAGRKAPPPAALPSKSTPAASPSRTLAWVGIGAVLGCLALAVVGILAGWAYSSGLFASAPTRTPMLQAAAPRPSVAAAAQPLASTPTQPPAAAAVATSVPPTEYLPDFIVCQVTDAGGIDDRSFNSTAWKGIRDAEAQLGIGAKYLESQQQTDYEKNIKVFIDEGCDLIVTVGFLLGDATQTTAQANPDQKFSIIDYSYDPPLPNVLGQVFATDQAAFLAGYVAASATKTGKVGTFGGIQIPPVTAFMDGFALGVQAYNEKHGSQVQVLGWDPNSQTGLFAGNFESTDDGRTMGETLMDEGADIIMPVAGPVGLGTAAAAKERGNAYIIGVDSDWYVSAPDFKEIILTSALKNMDATTFAIIRAARDGGFQGGEFEGTLQNGGVGLAPFHDLESKIPPGLTAELGVIEQAIISGSLATRP